jgi:signal transduction histidine kinase
VTDVAGLAPVGGRGRLAAIRSFDAPLGQAGLAGVGTFLVLLLVYAWYIPYAGPWPVEPSDAVDVAVFVGTNVFWVAATLAALADRRTVRFGWLLVAFAVADLVWTLGFIPVHALYFIADAFRGLGAALIAHLLIAFPSGRLSGRFDRWAVRSIYAFLMVTAGIHLLVFEPNFSCDPYCPRNPFAIFPNPVVEAWLSVLTPALVPVVAAPVLVAVARHWRAAGPTGRRVLLPVALAAPFQYAVSSSGFLAQRFEWTPVLDVLGHPVVQATAAILPAAFLLGILRARLARGRVADLAVLIGQGVPLGGLRDVLARTIGDPTLQLAFASPDGSGFVDPQGLPIDVLPSPTRASEPIVRDGATVAVLLHDPAVLAEDPELLRAVGSVAGLALENERLSAQVRAQLEEVRASRQRIVEAGDAERRRVERDLHDGAQQRLVALAMRLDAARGTTAEAQALLESAGAELGTAIAEVRQLARGLHPTILTEAGLRAAVEALAERTPVPVEVEADGTRYPATVEATAYFVIAEALTNVARYASASHAIVRLEADAEELVVEVRDDGRGGADAGRGSGLRGLSDRVAAIGGTLAIESPVGGGTVLRASLPLEVPGA